MEHALRGFRIALGNGAVRTARKKKKKKKELDLSAFLLLRLKPPGHLPVKASSSSTVSVLLLHRRSRERSSEGCHKPPGNSRGSSPPGCFTSPCPGSAEQHHECLGGSFSCASNAGQCRAAHAITLREGTALSHGAEPPSASPHSRQRARRQQGCLLPFQPFHIQPPALFRSDLSSRPAPCPARTAHPAQGDLPQGGPSPSAPDPTAPAPHQRGRARRPRDGHGVGEGREKERAAERGRQGLR